MAANLTTAVDGLAVDSTWPKCSDVLGNLTDGDYAVAAKTGNAQSKDQLAVTAFTIDSKSPTVQVMLLVLLPKQDDMRPAW